MTTSIRAACSSVFLLLALSASARGQTAPPAAPPPPDTASEAQGFLVEPVAIQKAVLFADRHLGGEGTSNGLYTDFGNMVPGAGWLSIGPGYRRWFKHDVALFDTSAALSWKGYKTAQARFELPKLVRSRVILGSQIKWQDLGQVAYFGAGPDSLVGDRTAYRLKSTDLVGYAAYRPTRDSKIDAEIGWLNPDLLPQGGFFGGTFPNTETHFAADRVFAVGDQPTFVHGRLSATIDTRDFAGHPTRGGVLRAAVSRYSDQRDGLFTFNRYEAEAARFIPFSDSRFVLAVRGWIVGSDTAEGASVPIYLQPTIGGSNSLRGFADYRFHDRNLLLLNTELRAAIMTHVDVAVFMDAGSVAPRVGDLSLEHRSYGAGVRLHSRKETYVRFDVARSSEGWRFLFRLTEPLSMSRLTRRTATVPFAP